MAAPNSQSTPNSQSPFSTLQQIAVISQTITPGSVGAANASGVLQTFNVAGLQTTDIIVLTPAATGNATTVGSAFCAAAGVLSIQFNNPTAGALTPGAGVYLITVFRPAPGIALLTGMPIL